MHLANIDFKSKVGKFGFSHGKKGKEEKELVQESLDILSQKVSNDLKREPNDPVKKKQIERFKHSKHDLNLLAIVDEDQDFELLDEESNLITYNDICDMIRGIHEHIAILERDGSYLGDNKEKYKDLRKILSGLNESRSVFSRTALRPQGLRRRYNSNVTVVTTRDNKKQRENIREKIKK